MDVREVLFSRGKFPETSFLHIMLCVPLALRSGRLCPDVPAVGGFFSSSSGRGIEEMTVGPPPGPQAFFSLSSNLTMLPREAVDMAQALT